MREYHFKQHVPGFVNGVSGEEFTFHTLDELLSHFNLRDGHIFTCDVPRWTCGDDNEPNWVRYKSNVYYLMESATYKEWWWVLGYTDFPLGRYLKKYDKIQPNNIVIDVNCSDQEILDFINDKLSVLVRHITPRCPLPCVVRLVAKNKRIIGQCTLSSVCDNKWNLTEPERIWEYEYVEKLPAIFRYVK